MNAPERIAAPSKGRGGVAAHGNTIDWPALTAALLDDGFARTGPLLPGHVCDALAASFDAEAGYRSHIHMARHNFGRGEYKYFAYPLPPVVADLRAHFYRHLVPAATEWAARLGLDEQFPGTHKAYLAACAAAGQTRPTPLVLRYGSGDFNCLHQDLYGNMYFPFQMAVMLNAPGADFEGGEFMLMENRPRMQSKGTVVPLEKGEAVIFAVNARPRRGSRGYHRAVLRHGVSEVRRGRRHTLGIIFHDAR